MEATLAKRRKSRLMHHPVAWITRGSDAWFTLAAILMNPVIVIALARVSAPAGRSGPGPVGRGLLLNRLRRRVFSNRVRRGRRDQRGIQPDSIPGTGPAPAPNAGTTCPARPVARRSSFHRPASRWSGAVSGAIDLRIPRGREGDPERRLTPQRSTNSWPAVLVSRLARPRK